MLESLKNFDKQVDAETARRNALVQPIKAELLPYIQDAQSYRPGLKKPWAERCAILREIDSHRYMDGLGGAEPYVTRLRQWTDPHLLIDTAVHEYNNINYDSITDPCGLGRWDVDPGRVAIVKGSIISLINRAKCIGELERTVANAKWWLEKEAESAARGQVEETVTIPPAPKQRNPVTVNADHNPLKH